MSDRRHYLTDAPRDGSGYVRIDGGWSTLSTVGIAWGDITGTLSDQTDLQSALDAKAAASHTHAWGIITGTLSDQTDLQAALDLKAPLANPTFTGSASIGSGAFFYLRNPANDKFASFSHDTVDLNLRFSGSTDFNIDFGSDLTGQVKVFADTHFVSGSAVQIRDATNSKTVTMSHDGDFSVLGSSTTNFDFQGATNMRLLAGIDLKIYDSTSQDIITIAHTGDEGQIYTNTTTGGDLHLGAGGTTQILTIDTGSYITVEGTMFLKEETAPKSNVAGYGQFWVKTATPNEPYFTDDADNDQLLDPSVSTVDNKTAAYPLVLGDKGKTIRFTSGSGNLTIPAESSVNFPIGTIINIVNDRGSDLSIVITTDTLEWVKDNTSGTRTLADGGMACIQKVASALWKIAGSGLLT